MKRKRKRRRTVLEDNNDTNEGDGSVPVQQTASTGGRSIEEMKRKKTAPIVTEGDTQLDTNAPVPVPVPVPAPVTQQQPQSQPRLVPTVVPRIRMRSMMGLYKRGQKRARQMKQIRKFRNVDPSEIQDKDLLRKIESFNTNHARSKDYYVGGIAGLVTGFSTQAEMLTRLRNQGRQVGEGNTQYPRCYYSILVTSVDEAIELIKSRNNDKGAKIVDVPVGSKYVKGIQVPFAEVKKGSSKILTIDEVQGIYDRSRRLPNANPPIKAEYLTIKPNDSIRISVGAEIANAKEGEYVMLRNVYYSNNEHRVWGFSLKAKIVDEFCTQTLKKSFMSELLCKVGKASESMNIARFDPIKPLTGGQKYPPDFYKSFIIPDRKAFELYCQKHYAPTKVYSMNIAQCLGTKPPHKKIFIIDVDVIEAKDEKCESYRRVEVSAAGFAHYYDDSQTPRLELFGVTDKRSFDILLRKSSEESESADEVEEEGEDGPFPTNPPLFIIAKKTPKIIGKIGSSGAFIQCPPGKNPFDLPTSHTINMMIQSVLPDIPYYLRNDGAGIPLKPEFALLLMMHKMGMLKIRFSEMQARVLQQLGTIDNSGPFVVKSTITTPNYINMSYKPMSARKSNEYYNLTEFEGDIAQFFRDVKSGKASFYLWAAGEHTSTQRTTCLLRTDQKNKRIRDTSDINEELLRLFLIAKSPQFEANFVKQLFIIYNDDLDKDSRMDDEEEEETG
ncbi:MAG: hypothetical protein ACTSUE_15840 [Promethearchaeota archaeon]